MLKKWFAALCLAFALVSFGSATPTAEASDYYIGTYSDGTNAFLVTESVSISSRWPYTFTCTVKYAHNYLYYSFYPVKGSPYYRNSEGYHDYVYGGSSPVAENIYRFVVNNY
jgi:hypothetical protein